MKAGDIALAKFRSLRSLVNRGAQAVVTRRAAGFSHVLVCVAPDVLIDATPENGVVLRNIVREVICERVTEKMCVDGDLRVFRPPSTNRWNPGNGKALASTLFQIGKKYNWRFLLPNPSDAEPESVKADSAFCSELVTIFLKQWGILSQNWRPPSKTVPAHLAELARENKWEDVTPEWQEYLKQLRQWSESGDYKLCRSLGGVLAQGNIQIQLMQDLKIVADLQKEYAVIKEELENSFKRLKSRARKSKAAAGKSR